MKAFGNIAKDSQVRAVASGTLPSGKPVVVNSDGTVSVVSATGGATSVGTPVLFRDSDTSYCASVYDTTNNKVVIAYMRTSTGYAVVGTVSGTSISFGSEAAFESGNSDFFQMAFDPDTGKVVIAYHDQSNSDYGTAVVGTVSGTSISFGTPVVFNSAYTIYTSVVYDTNADKIVIAYRDVGNSSAGTAIVGTVSGTSISFGSEATFESGETNYISAVFDSTNNKVVIAYQDTGDSSKGKAVVGTVSSTSISFGSIVEFEAGNTEQISTAYDSNAGKVVIAYRDVGNSDYGTAIVGTVSGTSISFGTAVVFLEAEAARTGMTYDSGAQKVVIVYNDAGNSNAGTVVVGTVSGTSISFGTPVVFDGSISHLHGAIVYDPDQQKVVTSYSDGSNGSRGTSAVITTSPTNLNSENYIGMSSGVVIDASRTSAVDTSVVFLDADVNNSAVIFDSSNNKFVVAFKRGSDSKGCAVVGTVSGTSISYGSVVEFEQGNSQFVSGTFDSSNNKVVLCFRDYDDSQHGKAIVGTVSGTSISFGTAVTFNAAETEEIFPTFDSNSNKVVIGYRNVGDNRHGYAIVGTVSGTSISFGSATEFENARISNEGATFDSSNNKVVFAYRDQNNSHYGTAIVGTVSGTSISFGTPVVYESARSDYNSPAFDSNENKVLIAFVDNGDSDKGKAIVGTVSGTSISFGSVAEFETNAASFLGNVFDSNANKFVIGYSNGGDSNFATLIEATVSGTSVSFGSSTRANASVLSIDSASLAFDSNEKKVLMTYRDNTNTKGRSVLYQVGYTDITRGQVANGGKAVIDSTNAISRNQIGLTAGQTYFVQTDGTLSETADSPSVTAGTAISATELIVKG